MLKGMIVIVCSALIARGDKILLIHESKVDKYGLPGGKLEEGESLRDCLQRELKEELGAKTTIRDLVMVTEKPRTHENNTVLKFIYRAEVTETVTEPELSYGYYDQAQIEDIITSGKLRGKDVEQLVQAHYSSTLTSLPEPVLFT